MKDLLTLRDFDGDDILTVIKQAVAIKSDPRRYRDGLLGKNLLMLFQKTSTRTRLSFEIGMQQLGGQSIYMDWNTSNFAISPIRYEAMYVARHVDIIMARLIHHSDVVTLAESVDIPVINGCSERYHPSQALADLLTIYEREKRFDGVTLGYIGMHNNVANSLVAAAVKVGLRLLLVTPEVNPSSWDESFMNEAKQSGLVEISDDPYALQKADYVYTDTWVDMENFDNPEYAEEKERRLRMMMPYQLRSEILGSNDPYIMHDMPVHPGLEIADELIESPKSVIFDQAENRLHAQKSLMLYLTDRAQRRNLTARAN